MGEGAAVAAAGAALGDTAAWCGTGKTLPSSTPLIEVDLVRAEEEEGGPDDDLCGGEEGDGVGGGGGRRRAEFVFLLDATATASEHGNTYASR